jgi:hypothetical protein
MFKCVHSNFFFKYFSLAFYLFILNCNQFNNKSKLCRQMTLFRERERERNEVETNNNEK